MPPVIKKIEPKTEIDRLLHKTWSTLLKPEWIEVGESKTCFPVFYDRIAENIENFHVRPDDVFIVSHPRSGTTWTQETAWLITHDCDYEKAKEMINIRVPYMENRMMCPDAIWEESIKAVPSLDVFEYASSMKSPRFFKTHVPFNLLPKEIRNNEVQPKIIYLIRNPKDVCVSFYHLTRSMYDFLGTFEEFCELFLSGRTTYGPYWQHVFSYWNQRHRPNILVVRYEDMQRRLSEVLGRIATFLNKDLGTEQIGGLIEHLGFEKFRKNEYVNQEENIKAFRKMQIDDDGFEKFMRKGKIGGYTEEMTTEMVERFDKWIEENTKGSDLHFE